jgi:hypothetical protein
LELLIYSSFFFKLKTVAIKTNIPDIISVFEFVLCGVFDSVCKGVKLGEIIGSGVAVDIELRIGINMGVGVGV